MRAAVSQVETAATQVAKQPQRIAQYLSRMVSTSFTGPSKGQMVAQAILTPELTLRQGIEKELRKSHIFKLLPKGIQQKKIESAVAEHMAAENSWHRGSSADVAVKRAEAKQAYHAALSPEQQKLSDRIERFNGQVLSGIITATELKAKQNQFLNELIVLSNTEPKPSAQYKEKIKQDIKDLSGNLKKGQAESLKLVDASYNSVLKGTERNLRFIAGMQGLQQSASLPTNLREIDFNIKVKEFERNRNEALQKKDTTNADNALMTIADLDRLKPKSFDNYSAMLDVVKGELVKGKTDTEVKIIKSEIALIRTFIDPEKTAENVSDARVEQAFNELQFYLKRDDLPRRLDELSSHLKNTEAQFQLLPEERQMFQEIRDALSQVSKRGDVDADGHITFGRVNTRQDVEQLLQILDQAQSKLSAFVAQNIIL